MKAYDDFENSVNQGTPVLGTLASTPELRTPPKTIAVVGAGIGGTATAYFLRQEFGAVVKIDVFEPGTGRLAT
ncbi:unnamed protein product [Coregonus sp. 'balchen']|uniref:L-amino-acid oxidase n=1 Tax=Coregonus suidteri TaxID=861788 RepID=A0AAN8L687_9TELE|nr:unnamed protein product [Coregonus sp. 'balchen']